MFYKFAQMLVSTLLRIVYRVRVEGDNSLKGLKGCIIYSNHFSFLDPIVLGCFIKPQVRFMAKKELFSSKFSNFVLTRLGAFPVRRGETDISAIKNAIRVLRNGQVLGIFPEGTRNKGESLLEAEPGLSMIAIKARVPVVPVAIKSNYKPFNQVIIRIGKPINLNEYYEKKLSVKEHKELSNRLMEKVAQML